MTRWSLFYQWESSIKHSQVIIAAHYYVKALVQWRLIYKIWYFKPTVDSLVALSSFFPFLLLPSLFSLPDFFSPPSIFHLHFSHTLSVCYTSWLTAPRSHDNREPGCVCRQPAGNAGHSTLSRRLSDFYEYMYTAESGGGFVFISLGDTSAAAPLHLFHLRRLRLALQVRSHHASMLPRHHSAAERAQALPLLRPSFSAGNFHQFLGCFFCVFFFP